MPRQKTEDAKKMVTLSTRVDEDKARTFKALADSLCRANGGYGPSVSQLLAEAIDELMARRIKAKPRKK